MYEENWNNSDRPEPWEQSDYRTGRTCPPKTRRGLLAVFLVAVIFFAGVFTAVSLLNIRLFQEQKDPEDGSFRFSNEETTAPAETQGASVPVNDDAQLQLHSAPEAVENVPQAGGLSLQEIYQKNISSVVSISCATRTGGSTGSGVVLTEDGYVVTNSHVVEGATEIEVLFQDETTHTAVLVGADTVSDLAVLYVQTQGLTPAEFGNDTTLRVGDSVVAIGDPLGIELRGTMTNGIVSAINRNITAGGRKMNLIQTNAALNAGNSGGPLINCYGQVIGINTMKIGDNMSAAGVEGLGFAIPSTTVKEIVDQLMAQGYVAGRPRLGISGQTLSDFERHYYRLPAGVYITAVEPESDAEKVGITAGDVLVGIDDTAVESMEQLQQAIYNKNAGDTVQLTIYRSGKQYRLEVTLGQAK